MASPQFDEIFTIEVGLTDDTMIADIQTVRQVIQDGKTAELTREYYDNSRRNDVDEKISAGG